MHCVFMYLIGGNAHHFLKTADSYLPNGSMQFVYVGGDSKWLLPYHMGPWDPQAMIFMSPTALWIGLIIDFIH